MGYSYKGSYPKRVGKLSGITRSQENTCENSRVIMNSPNNFVAVMNRRGGRLKRKGRKQAGESDCINYQGQERYTPSRKSYQADKSASDSAVIVEGYTVNMCQIIGV